MRAVRTGWVGLALACGAACDSPAADPAAIVVATQAPTEWDYKDEAVVTGRRWLWEVRWGAWQGTRLVVPVGRMVRLEVRSTDVEHRLQFAELGIDLRATPETPAVVWVALQREGTWRSRCVQECVDGDPLAMTLELVAVPPVAHTREVSATERPKTLKTAVWGRVLYQRYGCDACHELEATTAGPPLGKFWGSTQLAKDGRSVVIEGTEGERIVRRSMQAPTEFPLQGWAPTMPSYAHLDEAEVEAIVAFVRCLPTPDAAGCEGLPVPPL